MNKNTIIRTAYINFQKIMFTIGIQKEKTVDPKFLALLTEKDRKEAVFFAKYLLAHEEEQTSLWDLSWTNVLHKIKGEPLEEGTSILSGLFKTYVENLIS